MVKIVKRQKQNIRLNNLKSQSTDLYFDKNITVRSNTLHWFTNNHYRQHIAMHHVTLLLTAAVLAGASAVVDPTTADLPSDLKDTTDSEDEPKERHISWEAAEEILELVDELGNVTSRFYMFL